MQENTDQKTPNTDNFQAVKSFEKEGHKNKNNALYMTAADMNQLKRRV